MSDQFKALFENELLSPEVKDALKEAVTAYKTQVDETVRGELEIEFAKKFERDKTEISSKLFGMVNEAVDSEIESLKADIDYFRKMEVRYATKLEEFKVEYAAKLSESFEAMVNGTVTDEISEIKGDIMEAKRARFGVMVFEAFKDEFSRHGFAEDIADIKAELTAAKDKLSEALENVSELQREKLMENLLGQLTGSKRNVMQTILEGVATDKMQARFDGALDSVLEESTADVDADDKKDDKKDDKVITESDDTVVDPDRAAYLERLKRLSQGKKA